MQPIIEVRFAMVINGYTSIIPVIGKKPVLDHWEKTRDVSRETLEAWSRNCPRANNTGILTRLVPTLDLDLLQEDAAIAAEKLVRERFDGLGSILCRIGRAPKRAIPFRTKDPFKKLTTLFIAINGADSEKIEFLADGQQVVAHGIHPDTQTEYSWDYGDPTTIAYEKLPLITAEQAQRLQNDIVVMLTRDFGYVVGTSPKKASSTTRAKTARKNPKRDRAWVEAALEAECVAIANAMTGDRNAQLNLSAYNVFQIVHGNPGLLDEEDVRQRLFAAAEACGLVADDGAESAWRTIESGYEGARTQPRVRPLAKLDQPAAPTWGTGLGLASASAGFGTTTANVAPAPGARRIVRVYDGDKSSMLDEVEEELVRYQGFGLYQRGGQIVRTTLIRTADADNRSTLIWRLAPVSSAHLFEVFTRIIEFQKYDGRRKAWIPTDCPSQIPMMYEARRHWQVPTLLGVVHTPQLRADGSLVEASGYDPDTRLLFKFDGEVFPPVPAHPTKEDANAALKIIEQAISTFPFKTDVDLSVVLSLFLTALARRSFDLAPVHAITAPASGTGKSLLISLASILVCGQTAPVIAMGDDKNEFRKLFASQLLSGVPIIAIDNCEQPLTGDLLCQAVSEEQEEIRLFGHLQTAVVRAGSLITATGNNLVIGSDMSRRVLMSMLDAGVERPEKRVFKVRIKKLFRQRRGEFVSALLTVLRAARLARTEIEQLKLEPLGGFEEWCAWVRDPLVWLGRADPVASIEVSYENNVDREVLQTVILAWGDDIGLGVITSPQKVIAQASVMGTLGIHNHPTLREALLLVAEDRRSPGNLSAKRLGWWLRKIKNKPIGNLRLVKVKSARENSLWKLETI